MGDGYVPDVIFPIACRLASHDFIRYQPLIAEWSELSRQLLKSRFQLISVPPPIMSLMLHAAQTETVSAEISTFTSRCLD